MAGGTLSSPCTAWRQASTCSSHALRDKIPLIAEQRRAATARVEVAEGAASSRHRATIRDQEFGAAPRQFSEPQRVLSLSVNELIAHCLKRQRFVCPTAGFVRRTHAARRQPAHFRRHALRPATELPRTRPAACVALEEPWCAGALGEKRGLDARAAKALQRVLTDFSTAASRYSVFIIPLFILYKRFLFF